VTAALGDALADIVAPTKSDGIPFGIEGLDLAAKKARLQAMA